MRKRKSVAGNHSDIFSKTLDIIPQTEYNI